MDFQTHRTKMFVHLLVSKHGKIPYFLPPWQPKVNHLLDMFHFSLDFSKSHQEIQSLQTQKLFGNNFLVEGGLRLLSSSFSSTITPIISGLMSIEEEEEFKTVYVQQSS